MTRRRSNAIQSSGMAVLLPMIVMSLALWGCGNKEFPRPASDAPPPRIPDLQAQVRPNGVELTWTVPDALKAAPKDNAYRMAILRSDLRWENRGCLDCPTPVQQEILAIDPAYPQPALAEGKKLAWTDINVGRERAYRYQIAVQDNKKRQVSVSNPAVAKVVAPPPGLRDLTATTEQRGILLKWKPQTKDEQGQRLQGELQFMVERRSNGGAWETLSTAIRGNSFMDPAVASKQSYDYRVTPLILFEDSPVLGEPSVLRQTRAPEALPPPPPGTVWVIPSKGALEVQWTESEGRVGGYHVYRREGKEIIRLTAGPIERPPYVDRAVKRNTVYFYAVSAVSLQPEQREGLLSKWTEIRSYSFE